MQIPPPDGDAALAPFIQAGPIAYPGESEVKCAATTAPTYC